MFPVVEKAQHEPHMPWEKFGIEALPIRRAVASYLESFVNSYAWKSIYTSEQYAETKYTKIILYKDVTDAIKFSALKLWKSRFLK